MHPNRVVLVTGAARRVGARIATHLHARGADVAIHCRHSVEQAEALVARLNAVRADSACAFEADLSQASAGERLVQSAGAWHGRIDALVNNASTFLRTPLGSVDESLWASIVDGNLKAAFFTSQAAAPWLRAARGAIVNVTDARAERPLAGFSAYAAAKAGLVALTRALALELAPEVRVNAVAPGSLDWPEHDVFTEAEQHAIEAAIPLQRIGTGEDVARAVAFLLDDADYVTGHVLHVDGGASLVSR
ncbi:MAG: pteridine reductase [Burkholderiales bacterium]|jgi:pteridine reductase|nr:MAG: pteridine reductase [Burkholderiales bacterium]